MDKIKEYLKRIYGDEFGPREAIITGIAVAFFLAVIGVI